MTDPAPPTEKSPTRRGRRRLALRLGAALVPPLLMLGLGEVFVRFRYEEFTARPYFLPGIYASHPAPRRFGLVPGYEGRYYEAGAVIPTRTNELAMRDPPLGPARRQAERRVLFLGDSITFGRGVSDEGTYPRLCEGLWGQALGTTVATFNAGVPGYDTVQELASLRAVGEEVRPHLVLVGWYRNDVAVPTAEQPAVVIEGQLALDMEEYLDWKRRTVDHQEHLLDRSMLLRLARFEWKNARSRWKLGERAEDIADQGDEHGLERCLEALRGIQAWCREHGARLGVVLFPSREDLEADFQGDPPLLARVRAACRAEGIEVLDLLPAWRQHWSAHHTSLYLPRDRCHPNAEGHEQVARWVVEHFRSALQAAGQ